MATTFQIPSNHHPFGDSRDRDDYGQLAILAYRKGNLDDALELFNRAKALDALTPTERIFLMRTEYRLGRCDEALKTVRQVLTDNGQHAEALKTGGRIALQVQDAPLARQFWAALAERDPLDADAPLQLARITYREDEFEDAARWGKRLLRIEPHHPEGLAITAMSALRAGDLDDLSDLLVRYFAVDRDKALPLLSQLSRAGAPERYADALLGVKRRFGEDIAVEGLLMDARRHFLTHGLRFEIQSQDAIAAAHYRALRSLDASSADAARGLERLRRYSAAKMRAEFKQNNVEQAIEHGRKVVEIDPHCYEAWMTLARSHLLKDDTAAARDCFKMCASLRATDAEVWLQYARVLEKTGQLKDALDAYRRIIELASVTDIETADGEHVAEAHKAIRDLHAGALKATWKVLDEGNLETAFHHLAVAKDIDSDDENVAFVRRRLLTEMRTRVRELWNQQAPEVIDVCRLYLESVPDDIYVLQVLGRTLMNTRRFADARPVWERLAKLWPDDARIRLQIARCCNWLKLREDGLAAAHATLALDPKLAEAKTIADQLEAL